MGAQKHVRERSSLGPTARKNAQFVEARSFEVLHTSAERFEP
jgi:hypothetical protein